MTLTSCPDEGTLRAYLDHEAPDHDALTRHVRSCLPCAATLRELRRAAAVTMTALDRIACGATDGTAAATHAATGTDAAGAVPGAVATPGAPPRRRRAPRGWVAAAGVALAAGLVATPAGQSVASGVLSAFRSNDVTAVNVTTDDAKSTADVLTRLASAPPDGLTAPTPVRVASVAEAQRQLGFPVAQPAAGSLPAGLAATTPNVAVSSGRTVTVAFDEAKTRAYLRQAGSDLAIPPGYGDTRLVVTVPSAALLTYHGTDGHVFLVGSADPLAARTQGPLSLADLRGFLVQVPGIPRSLTDQLTGDALLSGTLPIPVPADIAKGTDTTVAGRHAVAVSARAMGTGLIWQEANRIVGVAGTYDEAAVRAVAEQVAAR